MSTSYRVGLVGARGHTGKVLLELIAAHPRLDLDFASSREFAGRPVSDICPELGEAMSFENLSPEAVAGRQSDVVILALPDGIARTFADALLSKEAAPLILDLSADYRFDPDWAYGLAELNRLNGKASALKGARRIANPGCYATAMQLAIAPLRAHLTGAPSVFGVSGYSGAGTTPNPRNDPSRLADNLIPYALTGHKHEREASHHLGISVRFTPHVHPAFSGLITTVHLPVRDIETVEALRARYEDCYGDEALIVLSNGIPELASGTNLSGVVLGGFALNADQNNAVVVAAIDNLLKGAALQAIQNVNIALGFDEMLGLPDYRRAASYSANRVG